MPHHEAWLKIKRRRWAARLLAKKRRGLPLTQSEEKHLSTAARLLLLTSNKRIGKAGRSARAAAGGRKVWEGTSAKERRVEMLRRAAIRKRNALARVEKLA